jgi:hypothetical protein
MPSPAEVSKKVEGNITDLGIICKNYLVTKKILRFFQKTSCDRVRKKESFREKGIFWFFDVSPRSRPNSLR